jgi:hypothetical protein
VVVSDEIERLETLNGLTWRDEKVVVGERVIVHAETFSAPGAVVGRSGRHNLKVRLDEQRANHPGDTLWFTRAEVERESSCLDREVCVEDRRMAP